MLWKLLRAVVSGVRRILFLVVKMVREDVLIIAEGDVVATSNAPAIATYHHVVVIERIFAIEGNIPKETL